MLLKSLFSNYIPPLIHVHKSQQQIAELKIGWKYLLLVLQADEFVTSSGLKFGARFASSVTSLLQGDPLIPPKFKVGRSFN